MGDIFHFFMAAQEKNLDTCINGFIKNVQKKEIQMNDHGGRGGGLG
jgi:hypothetical protein